MALTRNDPASWLDTLWEAIWELEACQPETDMDDVKTAMAWLAESLNLEAAAPDLLAALTEITAAYAMEEDTPQHNHQDRLDAGIEAGIAAIAKAKGD